MRSTYFRVAKLMIVIAMAMSVCACEMSPELMNYLMGLCAGFTGVGGAASNDQYGRMGSMIGTQFRGVMMESARQNQQSQSLSSNMNSNADRNAATTTANTNLLGQTYAGVAGSNPSSSSGRTSVLAGGSPSRDIK